MTGRTSFLLAVLSSAPRDRQQPNQEQDGQPERRELRASTFVFEIAGNPAITPTKIRQLGAVPFFLTGPDHPLFLLLPDALNTTDHAPKVGVSVKDVMYLILGGVALAPEVANGGIHFIIDPIRLTRFFSDIDAQLGAAYIPIHGNASDCNALLPACKFVR